MEHHHFQCVNPLYMAIFHSSVKFPEGNLTFTIHVLRYRDPRSFLSRKELHPHYNTSVFHDYHLYIPSISIIILHYIQLDPAIIGWYPTSYHTFFLVQSPSISRYSVFLNPGISALLMVKSIILLAIQYIALYRIPLISILRIQFRITVFP